MSRAPARVAVGVAVALAGLYRLVVFNGFPDDQYMHLAWAQQVLRGELPGRDFVEPGMPLMIALSAAAQRLLGPGILPEFVLCTAFLAAAAGVTCWLAIRLTGSPVLGLVAALAQLAVYTRPYNYPKIVVPVVALLLAWRYIDQPGVKRAAIVGAWTAVGFLFRHDYLVYLGATMVAAVGGVLGRCSLRDGARHLCVWMASVAILVAPYLVMLHLLGGVGAHFRDGLEFGRAEGYQWRVNLPRLAVLPPPALPSRQDMAPAGPVRRLARAVVLDNVVRASPIVNETNAAAAMYYGAFVLPLAAIGAVGLAGLRRRPRGLPPRQAQILALAALSLVLAAGFLRHPLEARLADLAGTMPLVVVVVAAAARHHGVTARACGVALVAGALIAACVHGQVWNRLYGAGLFRGPKAVASRVHTVWTTLRTWPSAQNWPQGAMPLSVPYLRACTTPRDRVLVTWFAPEIFTFADRGFAAGHAFFTRTHFLAPHYQDAMIERLRRQRVPVALVNLEQRSWLSVRFVALDSYMSEHYTVVDSYRNYDGAEIGVAVRGDIPASGVFPPTGWPCFQ